MCFIFVGISQTMTLSAPWKKITIKILIEAQAFIRIMVDVEVGSGRLLEATVLEWDEQLCKMIFVQIYLHCIIVKGKEFEKEYRISLKLGDGRLIESLFFSENVKKIGWFLPIFRGFAYIRVWASVRIFTVIFLTNCAFYHY